MLREVHMQLKLKFLGAAQNVTGSRHLLEFNGTRVLVDCGLYQERQFVGRNWDPFQVPPASIDAVLLTHAHLDHCGLLPKLVREGFKGRVYCHQATAEIAKVVLLDAAHLQEEDASYKRRRHGKEGRKSKRPVVPLYTTVDAEAAFPLFKPVRYERTNQIAPNVEATFFNAGHILGASMIKIKVTDGDDSRTVLFSGDVGRYDMPILKNPTVFEDADYVLIESTYGNRVHESYADIKDAIENAVNDAIKSGGNIIVPSFSVERAQDVLYYLNELIIEDRIPNIMTFLDSPMAIRVTEVFKDHPELFDAEMKEHVVNHDSPFDFPDLKMVRTSKESKAINHIRGTIMIIAGSGMCTGGRVKHHLVNNISRSESTVMFVGYQAFGTLGRRIVDGDPEVRILGKNYKVRAKIVRIHGFSGHADSEELLEWLTSLKRSPKHVFVIHGETDAANTFANLIKERTDFPVTVPAYNDEVLLD
ncbi:MAG: MBL fold metallo-hydrolase [Anaerohalosphaera sp.]|nr:MBL fold metallo-hydrolase [Anaerohalosphaera sp.]